MKKLMIFIALIAVVIYFVWPSALQIKEDKQGFESYKENTNKEFSDFKSKN